MQQKDLAHMEPLDNQAEDNMKVEVYQKRMMQHLDDESMAFVEANEL